MGYKEFMFELFDQNLIFQEGTQGWSHSGYRIYYRVIPGHEWQEARSALGRVFAADQLPEYLTAAKQ